MRDFKLLFTDLRERSSHTLTHPQPFNAAGPHRFQLQNPSCRPPNGEHFQWGRKVILDSITNQLAFRCDVHRKQLLPEDKETTESLFAAKSISVDAAAATAVLLKMGGTSHIDKNDKQH